MELLFNPNAFLCVIKIMMILQLTIISEGVCSPMELSIRSSSPTTTEPKISAPYCGGIILASFDATPIVLPHLEAGEEINCEWTIKAPHPNLKVGFAFVQIMINDFTTYPNNFDIDVYDGSDEKHERKLFWHGFLEMDILSPLVSSSDSIFLKLKMIGGKGLLDAKLIYFLCGGTISNDMEIRSPIFNVTDIYYDIPTMMECTWRLEKPKNAFYGYLHLHKVNVSRCDILTITTFDGEMIAVEKSTGNDEETGIVTTPAPAGEHLSQSHNVEKQFLQSGDDAKYNASMASLSHHNGTNKTMNHQMQICGTQLQAIAFSGTRAELKYSIHDLQVYHGFSAAYVTVRRTNETPEPNIPWYYNYATIAIYMPLGVVLGLIIMVMQGRRRGPVDTRIQLNRDDENDPSDNSSTEGNFGCGVKISGKSIMKSRRQRGLNGIVRDKAKDTSSSVNSKLVVVTTEVGKKVSSRCLDTAHNYASEGLPGSTCHKGHLLRHQPHQSETEILRTDSDTTLLKDSGSQSRKVTFEHKS